MTVWDELKVVLVRLRDHQPGAVWLSPMPEVDEGRQPPFAIHLAAWAVDAAEELHRQFGDDVKLTVGALPYPPGARPEPTPAAGEPPELLNPREIAAELDGPAVIKSGHELRHGLLLRNFTDSEILISPNGTAFAVVVDPQTGEVVGGFYGARTLALMFFQVAPGETVRIPFLIGTASFAPRLGYTVPAGNWGVQATLMISAEPDVSAVRRTPILPLTITA
jgi:hypothetical protein